MDLKCIFVSFVLLTLSGSSEAATGRKLLLMLLDGFRWDYLDQFQPGELKGFDKLRQEGSTVTRLIPEFPSLSFVNYYSIATGLHPESHGMVDNYMYDEKHNTSFLIGENPEQYEPYWWDEGDPFWITAKRQGLRSYMWYWCGCEVAIRGLRPDFCIQYLDSPNPSIENFTNALTDAVEVLRNGSADIAGVYLEQIDAEGHDVGPKGDIVKQMIRQVDAQLLRVQNLFETTPFDGKQSGSMFDNVDLIIFADHGMVERVGGPDDNATGAIYMPDYINKTDCRIVGSSSGPILSIWPKEGKEDMIYERLKSSGAKMAVYKKNEIPDRYFLKGHYRVPPIYLVADKGYAFLYRDETRTLKNVGFHGYDNALTDVHSIFMARGPDFKKGGRKESMSNLDIYGLLCNILGITASPNNGTISNTCSLVSDGKLCNFSNTLSLSFLLLAASLILAVFSSN